MSLINQMLQDLDARQAVHGAGRPLPDAVRPLPVQRSTRRPWLLGGLAVLLLAGGLALYLVLPGPSSVSLPLPVPAPLPPPLPQIAAAVVPPPAPQTPAPVDAVAPPEVMAPSPATPPPRAEQKAPAKPVKAAPVDADPAPARVRPQAAESPSPAVVDHAPPALGKAAKATTIARTEAAGSPRERAENSYRKAIDAVNQGRVGDAIDLLRGALREEGLHGAARQLLVKLLLEGKRSDEAIAVLQEGLPGQPAQIGWAMALARLQLERGDLAGAWQTLDFSLPAAGQSADYQGFAAHLLQRQGRSREAAEHYQAAARLSPGDGRWWFGLGLALDDDGRSAEAREAFLRARQSGNLSAELTTLVEQKLR